MTRTLAILDKLPVNNKRSHVTPVPATSAMPFHRRLNKITWTLAIGQTTSKQSMRSHVTPVQATPAMAFHRRPPKVTRMTRTLEILNKLPASNQIVHTSLLYKRHQRWLSIEALQDDAGVCNTHRTITKGELIHMSLL
jgi:hypothetical protein